MTVVGDVTEMVARLQLLWVMSQKGLLGCNYCGWCVDTTKTAAGPMKPTFGFTSRICDANQRHYFSAPKIDKNFGQLLAKPFNNWAATTLQFNVNILAAMMVHPHSRNNLLLILLHHQLWMSRGSRQTPQKSPVFFYNVHGMFFYVMYTAAV